MQEPMRVTIFGIFLREKWFLKKFTGGANGGGGEDDEGEFSNVVHIGSLPSIAGGTLWEAIKVRTFFPFVFEKS